MTLYPAMVNSPVTELSAAINDTVTTFNVLNGAALPDAPNIATIGQGELAETILYTGKSGNTLSGVTRGFQATARSWPTGSKVARNFTAYDYDTIRTSLEEAATIPAPIVRGINVINAAQASGASVQLKGRTLANILGNDGGCESLTPFSGIVAGIELSTTQKRSGTNSIKTTTSSNSMVLYKDYTYTLDQTKYYFLAVWVYIESFTSGGYTFSLRDVGTSTARYTASINTSLVGQWQLSYIKVPTSNTLVGSGFRLQFGPSSLGTNVSYWDEIRLYEVSAADYAAIGTTITGEAIDAYLPYVDGVKHLQGVSVRKTGKNLLPPFTQWNVHANAIITEPYKLTLNATGTAQLTTVQIKCRPNQQYTISVSGTASASNTAVRVRSFSASGSVLTSHFDSAFVGSYTQTFTTPATADYLEYQLYGLGAGTFTFTNPTLVLGAADQLPASFEPRFDQYVHIPTILASNVDRTIYDSYDSATEQVLRRWARGIKLSNNMDYNSATDGVGYTRTAIALISLIGIKNLSTDLYCVDPNGYPLRSNTALDGPNQIYAGTTNLFITVSTTVSGWGEDYTPTTAEQKAYMSLGWKMNNGTFGTPYNGTGTKTWTPWGATDNSNAVTTVPTTVANGYIGYTLDYALATPVVEQLTGDLGGLALDAGGNTLELMEGVIVRERVYPQPNGGNYYLNTTTLPLSNLSKRAAKILRIYKGVDTDTKWVMGTINAYGNERALIAAADYDPTAEYFVTFQVLDRYAYTVNANDATIVYQSTLGGAVAQATTDIAALQQHNGVQDYAIDWVEAKADNNRYDLDQATSAATPNTLVERDANGRFKTAIPVANDDVARLDSITKAQAGLGNLDNYATASQAEAEAGTAADKFMTSQRTKQAIDAKLAASAANTGGLIYVYKNIYGGF